MTGFFSDEEARAHRNARAAWLKASREALGFRPQGSECLRQISQQLTCDCGQKRLLTVSIVLSDAPDTRQNDIGVVGAYAMDRPDHSLEREVQDLRSGLKTPNAVLGVVHHHLHARITFPDATARAESEKPEFEVPPPLGAVIPRTIPSDRLDQLAGLSTQPMSPAERIARIREAAKLASDLRYEAMDYCEISVLRGGDAIGLEAARIADQLSDAGADALSTLLLLITSVDADQQMDQIERSCRAGGF